LIHNCLTSRNEHGFPEAKRTWSVNGGGNVFVQEALPKAVNQTESDLATLKKQAADMKEEIRAILRVIYDPEKRIQLQGEDFKRVSTPPALFAFQQD